MSDSLPDGTTWLLICQFAADWTRENGSALDYWRKHAEFAGDLHALCELLAVEYRHVAKGVDRDDDTGREKIREQLEQRLREETSDEAMLSLLQAQLELIDDGGETEIAPPVVGTMVAATDAFQISAIVEGTNEAETAHLGEGGFKSVRLANQQSLSRNVALKFPTSSMSVFHVDIEAHILKRLSHQNIPPVHGYRQSDPDHGCYIVETYVGRETWGQVLRSERDRIQKIEDLETRRSEWERVLEHNVRILHSVCQPVRYAHEVHGLAHVDLKPGNVMLRQPAGYVAADGSPYDFSAVEVFVIDWGEGVFVREIDDSEGLEARLVRNRPRVSGTRGYRPPELESVAGQGVDCSRIKNWFAIDVYSLGAILFQIITGRTMPGTPHGGNNAPVIELPQELKDARFEPG